MEWKLNKCVYENLVRLHRLGWSEVFLSFVGIANQKCLQKLEKVIPDQPKNSKPVELRPQQIFSDRHFMKSEGKPFNAKEAAADSKQAA
jgi:hypothetical protein